MSNTNTLFNTEISLDAEKSLTFKVQLSLTESELSLQMSDKKKHYHCSVSSTSELLSIGSPINCLGKNSLKAFYNSCKQLLSKPSNDSQHLGYFFFDPKSKESPHNIKSKVNSLSFLGKICPHYAPVDCQFLYLRFTIFDSINEETFVFYLALQEQESENVDSIDKKTVLEKRVQRMIDSLTFKINALMDDNEYWRKMYNQSKEDVKKLIEQNNHEKDKRIMLEYNSMPFVFGILSRHEDSNGDSAILTSQLGNWNSNGAEYMASILCGTHNYSNNYILFVRPPSLQFLQGSGGSFLYKEQHTCNSSTTFQNYPRAMLGAFFIENPTGVEVAFTLSHGGTSSWSSGYEGASVFIGVPDKTSDRSESVQSITWSCLFSYSQSNENLAVDTKVSIPAHKTVCLLIYTSPFSQNGSYNTTLFSGWKVFQLREALQKGHLKINTEMTHRAVQCGGLTKFHELWHE